jgi:glc operon protein GlcG
MRRLRLIASAFALAMLAGGQVIAQQPPPNPPAGGAPDVMPFDIPYGMPISAERAKQILAAAEAEAKKRNWKMNIAVVDPNGDLIHFLRMDGALIAGTTISQGKARTAARYRRPSQVFYNAYETGHPYVSTFDSTLVASPGGFPLVADGKLIGAIGCSGGTGDQDALICKVGADMIK